MTERTDTSAFPLPASTSCTPPDLTRRTLLGWLAATGLASLWPWQQALAQGSDRATLSVAYPTDVPTWDPEAVTIPNIQGIYQSVFDSPLRFSADGRLQARQFKEWRWTDNTATRLEVTLRDDIVFHDGSRMTMEDVKFSLLERGRADKKLVIGAMLTTLADVEIKSPTRGVLVYSRPTPTAPIYLAFMAAYIVPKGYLTKVGAEGFNAAPVGAGPYRMAEHQRGSRIVLEAFDKYWGGMAPIRQVILQIVPEPSARVALAESGRVGMALQLPVREMQRLAGKPTLKTKIAPVSEIYMLRLPSYVPALENEHVRAALHLAIDKAALSKAFYAGVAQPLSVLAPKGAPASAPDFNYPFDKARAISELQAAGYSTAKPLSLTLLSTNGAFPSDYDMARAIAQMWKGIGINATIEETTPAKLVEAAQNGKLAGPLLYSWANSTADPEIFAGRILDPRLRFSTWKDMALGPRIDSLITEPDETKRLEGYKALNIEASEKTWAIPLLQAVTTVAYASALQPQLFNSGYLIPAEYKYL